MIKHEDFERPCRVQVEDGRSWRTLFRKRYRTVFDGHIREVTMDEGGSRLLIEDELARARTMANLIVFPAPEEGSG